MKFSNSSVDKGLAVYRPANSVTLAAIPKNVVNWMGHHRCIYIFVSCLFPVANGSSSIGTPHLGQFTQCILYIK